MTAPAGFPSSEGTSDPGLLLGELEVATLSDGLQDSDAWSFSLGPRGIGFRTSRCWATKMTFLANRCVSWTA